jgi:hypothetical protein
MWKRTGRWFEEVCTEVVCVRRVASMQSQPPSLNKFSLELDLQQAVYSPHLPKKKGDCQEKKTGILVPGWPASRLEFRRFLVHVCGVDGSDVNWSRTAVSPSYQ